FIDGMRVRSRTGYTAGCGQSATQRSFMLRGFQLRLLGARREACIRQRRWIATLASLAVVACWLALGAPATAATVPSGFTETPVTGPWDDAVGITFETNGRM